MLSATAMPMENRHVRIHMWNGPCRTVEHTVDSAVCINKCFKQAWFFICQNRMIGNIVFYVCLSLLRIIISSCLFISTGYSITMLQVKYFQMTLTLSTYDFHLEPVTWITPPGHGVLQTHLFVHSCFNRRRWKKNNREFVFLFFGKVVLPKYSDTGNREFVLIY